MNPNPSTCSRGIKLRELIWHLGASCRGWQLLSPQRPTTPWGWSESKGRRSSGDHATFLACSTVRSICAQIKTGMPQLLHLFTHRSTSIIGPPQFFRHGSWEKAKQTPNFQLRLFLKSRSTYIQTNTLSVSTIDWERSNQFFSLHQVIGEVEERAAKVTWRCSHPSNSIASSSTSFQ